MKKNKKGFTLIELLAVIIILGVLMLIAIPSVTEYISSSRKKTYLSSGASFIQAVRIKVNNGADGLILTNPDYVYYVEVSDVKGEGCVNLEKGGKSPFGTWASAYVVVTIDTDGMSYAYSFTAKDSAGYGLIPSQEATWTADNVSPSSGVTFPTADGAAQMPTTLPTDHKLASRTEVRLVNKANSCVPAA